MITEISQYLHDVFLNERSFRNPICVTSNSFLVVLFALELIGEGFLDLQPSFCNKIATFTPRRVDVSGERSWQFFYNELAPFCWQAIFIFFQEYFLWSLLTPFTPSLSYQIRNGLDVFFAKIIITVIINLNL